MEILFWAPNNESEEMIFEAMKKTYDLIHTYKDQSFMVNPMSQSKKF